MKGNVRPSLITDIVGLSGNEDFVLFGNSSIKVKNTLMGLLKPLNRIQAYDLPALMLTPPKMAASVPLIKAANHSVVFTPSRSLSIPT